MKPNQILRNNSGHLGASTPLSSEVSQELPWVFLLHPTKGQPLNVQRVAENGPCHSDAVICRAPLGSIVGSIAELGHYSYSNLSHSLSCNPPKPPPTSLGRVAAHAHASGSFFVSHAEACEDRGSIPSLKTFGMQVCRPSRL